MKIGFDGRSLGSPAGGIRRYAGELLRGVHQTFPNLQLTVLGAPAGVPLPEAVERHSVHRLAPTNLGWSLLDLPRAVRKTGIDVFHAPAYTAPLRGVHPLVLTIHDVSYERHPEWYPYRRDALRRWFYRRSALTADRILTDSAFSRDEIHAAYGIPLERISVIPLGVGPPFTGPPATAPLPPGVREPYVLHVGDLHPRRNLRMLLRAIAKLASSDAPMLVLAGQDRGERTALMGEAARYRVTLHFTASADDSKLAGLYARAAAFVYPSRYEGFGLPLLEAMACGAPVVAARASSIPEVVGDAGILADPDSDDDFGEALARVLGDRSIAEHLRRAGRSRAAEFTWERTVRRTVDVYRQLASS
jgi:glycosyltransferase involved in cell wall biosynthesis